jgi:hypothetical protein
MPRRRAGGIAIALAQLGGRPAPREQAFGAGGMRRVRGRENAEQQGERTARRAPTASRGQQ